MKVILYFLLLAGGFSAVNQSVAATESMPEDTVDIQVLYNGRVWRNLYYRIHGDQFFFNSGFVPGSVSLAGRTFRGQSLRLDSYSDELLLLTNKGIILQLNKELIDEFSLEFNSRSFRFRNLRTDSLRSLTGFVNILSEGTASLYVKYIKEILVLAVENKYDLFTENQRIYLEINGITSRIGSQGDLLRLFGEKRQQVRAYMKSNGIRFIKKDPESIKPVVDYYNTLQL